METITNFNTAGVAVHEPMLASRGILALQGIGSSGFGANGLQMNSAQRVNLALPGTSAPQVKSALQTTISTLIQDKPSASWHPAFAYAAVGVVAVAAGYEPAAADMTAARLRTADPATVIRTRQRCRTR